MITKHRAKFSFKILNITWKWKPIYFRLANAGQIWFGKWQVIFPLPYSLHFIYSHGMGCWMESGPWNGIK